MRYHWGLGVGHFHVHQPTATLVDVPNLPEDPELPDFEQEAVLYEDDDIACAQDGSDVYDSDNPELGLDDRQSDGWEEVEYDEDGGLGDGDGGESMDDSDEDYTGM
jgi:hypothetical protein